MGFWPHSTEFSARIRRRTTVMAFGVGFQHESRSVGLRIQSHIFVGSLSSHSINHRAKHLWQHRCTHKCSMLAASEQHRAGHSGLHLPCIQRASSHTQVQHVGRIRLASCGAQWLASGSLGLVLLIRKKGFGVESWSGCLFWGFWRALCSELRLDEGPNGVRRRGWALWRGMLLWNEAKSRPPHWLEQ